MSTMKVDSIKRVDGTDWVCQYFNTIQDLKNNMGLLDEGMMVAVKGLDAVNDTKQSFYVIRYATEEATPDETHILTLNGYLVAKLTMGYYKEQDVQTANDNALAALEAVKVTKDSDTGAAQLPSGETDERPTSPANGYMRYNTDLQSYEGYAEGAWGSIGGGARGGVGNSVFYENDADVNVDYTITAGKNAMTAGPVTIADAVVVSIPDGSNWSIV